MKICAISLDSGVVPRVSSITPRPSMRVQVTSAAIEVDSWFTSAKNGRNRDAMRAATSPRYIAIPPIVGSGTTWTVRSFGR